MAAGGDAMLVVTQSGAHCCYGVGITGGAAAPPPAGRLTKLSGQREALTGRAKVRPAGRGLSGRAAPRFNTAASRLPLEVSPPLGKFCNEWNSWHWTMDSL